MGLHVYLKTVVSVSQHYELPAPNDCVRVGLHIYLKAVVSVSQSGATRLPEDCCINESAL